MNKWVSDSLSLYMMVSSLPYYLSLGKGAENVKEANPYLLSPLKNNPHENMTHTCGRISQVKLIALAKL